MFTMVTDSRGRTVALTDAATCELLARASKAEWVEVADVAWGYSRDYHPGSPIHALAVELDQTAGGVRVDYIYSLDVWDHEAQESRMPFVEARAARAVVCGAPHSGYADMEASPVRWSG